MRPMEAFLGPRIPKGAIDARPWHFVAPTLFLAFAALLLVTSVFLPYWKMELQAPQYPNGLKVRAHLDHLEGDVREIDGLNHYIGMRPLAEAAELERSLSVAAVLSVALLLAAAIFIHSRWAALLALPGILFPLFFLADLQYWLYDFGTNLDPKAPLSSAIEPFVPPVLGRGTVGQFATVAVPGAGLWLAFLASAVIVGGLYYHRRVYKPLFETVQGAQNDYENDQESAGADDEGQHSALALLVGSALLSLVLQLGVTGTADAAHRFRVTPQSGETALQRILQRAGTGDTVIVEGGVWKGPIRVDRSVRLLGRGRPVIDGGGTGTVVSITAPGVTLEGFTIRASGASLDQENSGIAVEAPQAQIVDNRLEDVLFGIYLRNANGSSLRENSVVGKNLELARRGDAIRVWYSDDVVLEGNRVDAARDVVLWYSDDLAVLGNRVRNGRYGLHFMYCDQARIEGNELVDNSVGAFLMYSRRLRLTRNLIAGNHGPSGYGVGLKDMDDAEVRANRFVGNRVGIFLDNTPREIDSSFLAEDNLLAANDFGVSMLPSVRRAMFLDNSFVENLEQVSIDGGGGDPEANTWRGNHWSDYAGFDADDDGIGDVPHRLDRLFESLGDRRPALRLFSHSPASSALDLASRAFPIVRPRPKLTDPAPSMAIRLPVEVPGLAGVAPTSQGARPFVTAGAVLVSVSVLIGLSPLLRRRLVTAGGESTPRTLQLVGPSGRTRPTDERAVVLETLGLTKRYGDDLALDGLDLEIRSGDAVALWGANGAGKTTALRALLGVIPYQGEVRVDGDEVWRNGRRARRRLGFVPQEVTFQADLGVLETLELFARLRGTTTDGIQSQLDHLGLTPHSHKKVGELSGGLRQRLALAVALLNDPPILLLDEPTANLDARARHELLLLLQSLAAEGKTLVFSSHRPEEVLALADRMIHLHEGRIVRDGHPRDVLADRHSELWLRPRSEDLERAHELLEELGFAPRLLGEALLVSVKAADKADVLGQLSSAGVEIEDFDLAVADSPPNSLPDGEALPAGDPSAQSESDGIAAGVSRSPRADLSSSRQRGEGVPTRPWEPISEGGRIDLAAILTLAAKELRDAWRNRWFLLYTAAFGALALGMSWLSVAGAAGTGFAGLGRTAASLVHLVMLVVPLMGLTLGAAAIAGERERGSLILLLAQPVGRLEVIAAKFVGLATAVLSSVLLGFGLALLVIGGRVRSTPGGADALEQLVAFLSFLGLASLVAVLSVSLGLAVSAFCDRSSVAGGISLFVWLALVILGDLGLMGTSLVLRLDARHLLWAALVNPLQEFKVAALLAIRGGVEVLGPAGVYASRTYGEALMPMLVGGLLLWIVVPLGLAAWRFERRGAQ